MRTRYLLTLYLAIPLLIMFSQKKGIGQKTTNKDVVYYEGQRAIINDKADYKDIVYYKSGETKEGTISVVINKGKTTFWIRTEEEIEKEIILKEVNSFAIVDDHPKKRVQRIFENRTTEDISTFVERIYWTGDYALYHQVDTDLYFLRKRDEVLQRIPNDRNKKKAFFIKEFRKKPFIIGKSAYHHKLNKQLINYLDHPFRRYPSTYYGLRLSYGGYKVSNISDNILAAELLGENNDMFFSHSGITTYLTIPFNRKNRIFTNVKIGGYLLNSRGQIDKTIYSKKGYFGNLAFSMNYYSNIGKLFPFISLGAKSNFLLNEKGIVANQNVLNENSIELEFYDIGFFNVFDWSPTISLGTELALKDHNFISLECELSTTSNLLQKRIPTITASLGINLY